MSELPLHLFCARCGQRLERGRTYYIVTVTLTAEVEGGLPEGHFEGGLEAIFNQVQKKSAQELEEEVYQRFQFLLCKPCRDVFVQYPLGEQVSFSPVGQT
jgi:hypothetical protein